MVNDQYTIPNSAQESSPLNEALRIADAAQYTAESQPAAFEFIKKLENEIDSYRDTAIEMKTGKKTMWSRAIEQFVVNTKSPLDQLIEKESRVGGALYPSVPDARFWLDKRHESDPAGARNWLFSYTNPQSKQLEAIVYQTTPRTIHKLYSGLERPLSEEEKRNFIQATLGYKAKVRHELYPLDDALEDLGYKDEYDLAA